MPITPRLNPRKPQKVRILARSALVGATALLVIAVKLIYDVPDDLRYRYSTVLFAIVVSALQLAVTLKIAGPNDLRDTFAPQAGLMVLQTRRADRCADRHRHARRTRAAPVTAAGRGRSSAPVPPQRDRARHRLTDPRGADVSRPGLQAARCYGRATAIVLTSLAFGLSHGQLQQLPALIAFGCAMGYLRSATNSIYPAIATHAAEPDRRRAGRHRDRVGASPGHTARWTATASRRWRRQAVAYAG